MYVFLDFEASSLNKQSYPIEVGWVREDGGGESHLIRPAPGWTDWDDDAAGVHGITRAQLAAEGEPHDEVCAHLLAVFENNTVLVSAPSWDGHWLSMLLRAAGKPRHLVRFQPTQAAFLDAARRRLGDSASEAMRKALVTEISTAVKAETPAHRALADARREWLIWRRIAGDI